jgi:glycosyltransferase involved in cell wall biosynthesis
MNKILMVTTIPDTLTAFLLPFARHFRAQGWQVDAMACGISGFSECKGEFDQLWEVQWSRSPLDPRNLLAAPHQIQDVVRQEKYDIVHVHTPVAAFVTRYALRDLKKQIGVKVIYTAHGFHFHPGAKPLKNAVFVALEKLAGRWNDYLVVINREDEKAAQEYCLNPLETIRYMPGIGVDLNYYSPDATPEAEVEQVSKELGLNAQNSLFLMAAELNPRKRQQDILKALAKLKRPNICMAFAGEGPMLEELQQLASELGVQNQVRFLGFRSDITALMRASVATILPSEREGLPRCIMESLCLEVPAIGTNIRGIRDLVTEDCGLLVEVGDVDALAQAMAWVLDHPEAAHMMGKQGRQHMTNFDVRHIIDLHERLYAEDITYFARGSKTRFLANTEA